MVKFKRENLKNLCIPKYQKKVFIIKALKSLKKENIYKPFSSSSGSTYYSSVHPCSMREKLKHKNKIN
jgi:hypothetical protein